jgi:osmoprotectant transport system permease protein
MEFLGDVVSWFTTADHWSGRSGVPTRLREHLVMSLVAVLAAAAIALPIGLGLGHLRRGGALAMNLSNVGRAIPSLAILVLGVQLFGIGERPAFVALVALAVPPIVTNSYVGMSEVDDRVRDAARGMGMTGRQMLLRVELPVALPLVLAGLRNAAVQVVATATLAALVAWGGLGRFIVDGLATRDFVEVFAGAALVAVVAVTVELALGGLQRLVVSEGLRTERVKTRVERATAVPVPPSS